MVADLVPRDRPEPAAEGVAALRLAEAGDVRRHRLEHLLQDVGDLLLREIPTPTPSIDEGRIQRDQPVPRRRIIRPEPLEQRPGRGRGATGSLPSRYELGRVAEVATHVARCRRVVDGGQLRTIPG